MYHRERRAVSRLGADGLLTAETSRRKDIADAISPVQRRNTAE
jgi:hypothetical protein